MHVHPSLGAWRNRHALEAAQNAVDSSEPLLGPLDPAHMQICPQNPGVLDEEYLNRLQQALPATQFRLHANARVPGWSVHADASTWPLFGAYFEALRQVSHLLQAPAYTWHAGLRRHATLPEVLQHTQALEQKWGIAVGIEGLYPTDDDRFLLSSWEDYAVLLDSGVRYALDLSHLNIVREARGQPTPTTLVRELLSAPQCLEIHLSANDGTHDQHAQLGTAPWWWDDLQVYANPHAHVFTEGGQVRPVFL